MHNKLFFLVETIFGNKNFYSDANLQSLFGEDNFIPIKDLVSLDKTKTIFEEGGFDLSKNLKMEVTLMKVIRDRIVDEGNNSFKLLVELDPSGTKIRKLNID